MEDDFESKDKTENISHAESFNDVLFPHIRRITFLASTEMRGGYYSTVTSKAGGEKEIYVPDTRESYCNAVLCLAHISSYKFDKIMKKAFEEFNTNLKNIKDNFMKNSSIQEKVILGEGFYTNPKDQVLLEEYRIMKLELFQSLFLRLNKLFGRKNWMEIAAYTEED